MRIIYSDTLNKLHDLSLSLFHIVPFIGYQLNRKENFKPFFIIGSGRSGNTLLRRILHANEYLFIPPETYVLGKVIKVFRQNKNFTWRNLVYLILAYFEFHKEFETFNILLRPLAQRLIKLPKNKRSLAYIINSFYQFYAEEKGLEGRRWGDKSPVNTLHLERIYSVFPDAQFIHIIRDGCDVVWSYCETGIYNSIESAAKRWLHSIKLSRKFGAKHPRQYFELKYEELVREPEKIVAEICNFLNIPYNPDMINSEHFAHELGDVTKRKHHSEVLKPISSNKIGRGRKNLTLKEKKKLEKILGKELISLGYEPCIPS